ncbi:hypothetical protein A167_02718 [Alcanivorax sp. S71-1-4]|jgi:hypothetical protein|uniref:ATP-dependent zinc protease family protein n=1 Tax=Alcanivorax sp. S71-1-4 TaxID=1177159 RepID=UPI0013578C3A|nr:RimK/LysX family protein [Alcanivorax sp. S71-1-4]KAF0808210.1 hypothetical protein A167_02718 [Alcanivorax sp. S71-1-4]
MKFVRILTLPLLAAALGVQAQDGVEINHKVILGLHEHALVKEIDHPVEAKLDTGAVSASLSAYDIEMFNQDGKRWVRFRLGAKDADDTLYELPLDDTVRIRRRLSDIDPEEDRSYTRRPVVRLTVCIGEREVPMRVNLADRRNFNYPLLVGSEGLRNLRSLIDPEMEFSSGKPRCTVTLANLDDEEEQQ